MIRFEMKIYNMTLTEKQQIYQHYHLENLINMNILQVKKYQPQIKEQRQNKISLVFSFRKISTEKQTKNK